MYDSFCLFSFYIFFFFFQAEDGIRDGRVTGVQTCALPIWYRRKHRRPPVLTSIPIASPTRSCSPGSSPPTTSSSARRLPARRSEERRVGKECRSRWSADH